MSIALQIGLPGTQEMIIVLLIALLTVGAGLAVSLDAKRRNADHAVLWGGAVAATALLTGPLVLLVIAAYVWVVVMGN